MDIDSPLSNHIVSNYTTFQTTHLAPYQKTEPVAVLSMQKQLVNGMNYNFALVIDEQFTNMQMHHWPSYSLQYVRAHLPFGQGAEYNYTEVRNPPRITHLLPHTLTNEDAVLLHQLPAKLMMELNMKIGVLNAADGGDGDHSGHRSRRLHGGVDHSLIPTQKLTSFLRATSESLEIENWSMDPIAQLASSTVRMVEVIFETICEDCHEDTPSEHLGFGVMTFDVNEEWKIIHLFHDLLIDRDAMGAHCEEDGGTKGMNVGLGVFLILMFSGISGCITYYHFVVRRNLARGNYDRTISHNVQEMVPTTHTQARGNGGGGMDMRKMSGIVVKASDIDNEEDVSI